MAVGYHLDELPNDITKTTPASFEPVLDYVVVKIPRFAFEKFPAADPTLTTQMKSVGEVMAIGRTFKEAFQKGFRGLEIGRTGWVTGETPGDDRLTDTSTEAILAAIRTPTPERLFQIRRLLERDVSIAELAERSLIDPWFLGQMEELIAAERAFAAQWDEHETDETRARMIRRMKQMGFSDHQLGQLIQRSEDEARALRHELGVRPAYKIVDTCAGEFPSKTPYLYSSYDEENEAETVDEKTVIILGSGPNRIGQGVEFDYCCVRAVMALREAGYRTVMVNSNPETVSTDFDMSDALYFEPLTLEDVIEIVHVEQPIGVVVQLGGQTPLRLARGLEAAGVTILGTSPDAIDEAEDRGRFEALARQLKVEQPDAATALSVEEATAHAERIGYPVLIRPSYVLGGRAMHIVYDPDTLRELFAQAVRVAPGHPVLIDKFLQDAFEVDVDAIADGERCVIGGVMQHIEEAGIHSGDSACVMPPYLITEDQTNQMKEHTRQFALELGVRGLMNVQYAVHGGRVYVIEVNPRASRTIPYVSKTTGVPLASLAARIMVGESLESLGLEEDVVHPYVAVKEAVFPFTKLQGVDLVLGPEMRST
ncbi:MAG: carbamoyl-phosphate synthase large subunit, partial [Gemmatimonadales bacterium]